MRPPLILTSPDNPRLKNVVHLRKPRDRRESGLFVAEGRREIGRALDAGLTARELFFSPDIAELSFEQLSKVFPQLTKLQPAPSIYQITPPLFSKIAYLDKPEGLLATFDQPTWTLDDLPKSDHALFLIAQGIEKPGNLGAMVRTAAAAGATAVLLADEEVDAFNPNAIRASTGAVFTTPTISAPTPAILSFLTKRNIQIVTATPDARDLYTTVDLRRPTAIVIGAEDTGVTPEWRNGAVTVRIPMAAGIVDSLNASTSAAILLFEAVRQRDR